MSRTIYRKLDDDSDKIVSADRWWLRDNYGYTYLDLSSGPICASLGHTNQFVVEAIKRQLSTIPNVFSGFWASQAADNAGNTIARMFEDEAPGWFGKVIFQNGGGEAVDLACKLAYQVHAEEEDRPSASFVALEHAFHGVGLLPFALSGEYPRYKLVEEYHSNTRAQHVIRVPHPMTDKRAITELEHVMQARHISAVIIEPVGGPPVGGWVHSIDYMVRLRELCNDNDALLIYDEVLCGAGRCGFMSAASLYNVWPDICILGKGITSGYQPMSAICLSRQLFERLSEGTGTIMFGTTYSAHTAGCAAIDATLSYMRENDLLTRVRSGAGYLQALLLDLLGDCDPVKTIQGTGYLWGIGLAEPRSGLFYPPPLRFHERCRNAIRKRGVVVYSKGQTVHGAGDYLMIAPPFEMDPKDMAMGVSEVRAGIMDAMRGMNDELITGASDNLRERSGQLDHG